MPSLLERDAKVIANIGRLRFSPLCLIGGRGNRLIEEGGRELLDLSASFGPAILGYAIRRSREAVTAACGNMAGASLLAFPNENAVALAEELLQLTPGRRRPARLVRSFRLGCQRLRAACRAGRHRPLALHLVHRLVSRQSFGFDEHQRTHGDDPYPAARRLGAAAVSGSLSCRTSARDDVLKLLDYQFATTCPPHQVAAVFIEPLMADGGLIVPPPGFLAAMQDRCRRHGIQVIVDEVKVGLARSGKLHCFEHEGLEPDSGRSWQRARRGSAAIGADRTATRSWTMRRPSPCRPPGAIPVATAAGRAVLRVDRRREGLIQRANRIGAGLLANGLHDLCARHPMIGDVRGRGLALGVELVSDRASRAPVPVDHHGESHLSRVSARGRLVLRGTARERAGIHAAIDA